MTTKAVFDLAATSTALPTFMRLHCLLSTRLRSLLPLTLLLFFFIFECHFFTALIAITFRIYSFFTIDPVIGG